MWNGYGTKQAIKLAALFAMEGRTLYDYTDDSSTRLSKSSFKRIVQIEIKDHSCMSDEMSCVSMVYVFKPWATKVLIPRIFPQI